MGQILCCYWWISESKQKHLAKLTPRPFRGDTVGRKKLRAVCTRTASEGYLTLPPFLQAADSPDKLEKLKILTGNLLTPHDNNPRWDHLSSLDTALLACLVWSLTMVSMQSFISYPTWRIPSLKYDLDIMSYDVHLMITAQWFYMLEIHWFHWLV